MAKTLMDLLNESRKSLVETVKSSPIVKSVQDVISSEPVKKITESAPAKFIGKSVSSLIKPIKQKAEYAKEVVETGIEQSAKIVPAVSDVIEKKGAGRGVALNNLYQAVSGVIAAPLAPAFNAAIEATGKQEELATALKDAGEKTVEKLKLDRSKLTDEDILNIGATELDAAIAAGTIGFGKLYSSAVVKSAIKGMKAKGELIAKSAAKIMPETQVFKGGKKNIPKVTLKVKPVEVTTKVPVKREPLVKIVKKEDNKPAEAVSIKKLVTEDKRIEPVTELKPVQPKGVTLKKIPEKIVPEFKPVKLPTLLKIAKADEGKLPIVEPVKKKLTIKNIIKETEKSKQEQIKSEKKVISDLSKEEKTPDVREAITMAKENIQNIKEEPVAKVPVAEIQTRIEEGGNVIEGKSFAYKPEKLDAAKIDIQEGKAKPVKLETLPSGKLTIVDGHHRIDAAIELGVDIPATVDKKPVTLNTSMRDIEPKQVTIKPISEKVEKIEVPKELAPNIATTTTDKILERETIKEPEFKKSLQLIGGLLNRTINLDQFLSGIRVKVGDKFVSLNNHIQSLKNISKTLSNEASRTLGIESKVKEIMDDSRVEGLVSKIGDDAFIGAVTPEGIEITSNNFDISKKVFEGIKNMDYSETFSWVNDKKLNEVAQLDYIYKINKNRPEIIDKYIPKDLQEKFAKLSELKDDVYNNLGQDLSSKDLLSYTADNYERYIMTPEMYKELKSRYKDVPEFTATMPDGSIRVFDTFLDMTTFVKNAKRMGTNAIPNVESLSSITKSKAGAGIDAYRTHSDVLQYLDYIREYGKLIRNDEVIKAFENLGKSKDEGVRDYVKNLFSSRIFENPIEATLGIRYGKKGITNAVERASDFGTSAVMAFGVDTLLQAITSSLPRAALLTKFNIYKNLTPEVNGFLREQGFIQTFEGGTLKNILGEKNIAFFSGTPIENLAKTQVSLDYMKNFLQEKGVSISKNDGSEIVSKFKESLENGTISKEEYLQFKDNLFDDLNFLGNVSSLARTNISFLSRLGFGKLKSFNNNYVANIVRDANKIVEYAVTAGKEGAVKGPVKRLAINIAGYYATYKAIKSVIDASSKGEDIEEMRSAIAQRYAEQAYGSPLANIKSFFSGTFSNLATLPVALVMDAVNTIALVVSQGDKELSAKIGINELLNDILSKTQAGQLIEKGTKVATGKSLREIAAGKLGVMNREGTTKRVQATGFKIDSRAEALASILGYNQDSAVQNFIYSSINKADLRQEQDLSPAGVAVVSFVNDIAKQVKRDVTAGIDLVTNFKEYNDELMDANYTNTAVKAMKGNDTLSDYLVRLGIPQQFVTDISRQKDVNIQSMVKSNNKIEQVIGEYFRANRIEGDNFSERLTDLQKKNPQAFNNFITGIAKTMRFLDEGGSKVLDKNIKSKLQTFFGKSTTATDAAIAQATGTDPLSTSVTQIMQNALFDFADNIEKEGVEEAERKLQEVESLYKIIMSNSSYTDGIINAASNKSLELKNGIDKMIASGYKGFEKKFPLLKEVITRGLELRGEYIPYITMKEPPVVEDIKPVSKLPEDKITTTLPTAIGVPKQEKLKLIDLIKVPKSEKPKPTISSSPVAKKGLSLMEILEQSRR